MEEILRVNKDDIGIRVEYQKGSGEDRILFSFQELIDLQINISHLIQYPGKYQVDSENHRIVRKKHGQ
jgi:hypothetical protein